MLTLSNNKNFKNDKERRTTKTKASAQKPTIFSVSMTRNKNNHNPILFGSVKKSKHQPQTNPFSNQYAGQYKSQRKSKKQPHNHNNVYEDVNTKISINYINSLYSDLAIQLGYKLRQKLQNKQNNFNSENKINLKNLKVELENKDEKQCFQKIKQLILLKQKINKKYTCMENTRNLCSYVKKQQIIEKNDIQIKLEPLNGKQQSNKLSFDKDISWFIEQMKNAQIKIQELEKLYKQKQKQIEEDVQIQQNLRQQQEDERQIESLKAQIERQRNLCLRFKNQEKLLMKKLQNTQKKTNQLRNSYSNLKMKNIDLKQTLRLSKSFLKPSQKGSKLYETQNLGQKTLKRSLSMKLQKIRQYNIQQNLIQCENKNPLTEQAHQEGKKIIKSNSTNSLNLPKSTIKVLPKSKLTFLDKIY